MKLTGKVQHVSDVVADLIFFECRCIALFAYSAGANSQSLAQYSSSLQAIADQYSKWLSCSVLTVNRFNRSSVAPRQASMVASMAREGDLGTLVVFAR